MYTELLFEDQCDKHPVFSSGVLVRITKRKSSPFCFSFDHGNEDLHGI